MDDEEHGRHRRSFCWWMGVNTVCSGSVRRASWEWTAAWRYVKHITITTISGHKELLTRHSSMARTTAHHISLRYCPVPTTTTNTPEGYMNVNDYNNFSGKILDISVYYNTKDLQTYGLVQFKGDT
jgi:hypothetical protein